MKIKKIYFYLLIISCVVTLIKYFFEFSDLITHNYLPIWSDEFFYYVNAYSVYINKSLTAALTYNGAGSKLFGSDAHGFMYPLTHGVFAYLIGWHNLNIVFTNLLFLFLSALYVLNVSFLNRVDKLFCLVLILCYPFGFLYGFTFMQETINIFFAVIASKELYLIYKQPDKQKKHIALFVLILCIAALYRPTWLFGLVMLIPIATSKKQLLVLTLVVLACISTSFVYVTYFFEFVPNFFNHALESLHNHGIITFIDILFWHFYDNIDVFTSLDNDLSYIFMKFVIIFLAFMFLIQGIIRKEKVLLATSLFFFTNILFLFILYDAHSWREIRFLSPLFYFAVFMIAQFSNIQFKLGFTCIVMIVFFNAPISEFKEGRDTYAISIVEQQREQIKSDILNQNKDLVILLDSNLIKSPLALLSIPVKTNQNNQIRYIVPYYEVDKHPYDYVLDGNFNLKPNPTTPTSIDEGSH